MIPTDTQSDADGGVAWRIALVVLIIAAIVWLGSMNARIGLGGALLKPGTLEFKEYIPPDAEREVFRQFSLNAALTAVSYLIVFLSATAFLLLTPLRLKENGWLMMSTILFYACSPIEWYTFVLDVRMAYLEVFTSEGNDAFRELFLARAGALAGAPFIAQLCYYTIIGLAVFRPLRNTTTATL
jgi:hypothetical protein